MGSSTVERVNVDNFKRAESHHYFKKFTSAAGLAKFAHFREPTPIDKQDVIRMNRDTLYSSAVVDFRRKLQLPSDYASWPFVAEKDLLALALVYRIFPFEFRR